MYVEDERVGGLVGQSPMKFLDKLFAEMSNRQFEKEQKKNNKKKIDYNSSLVIRKRVSCNNFFFCYSVTIITSLHTVKILKFGTPQTIAIIAQK